MKLGPLSRVRGVQEEATPKGTLKYGHGPVDTGHRAPVVLLSWSTLFSLSLATSFSIIHGLDTNIGRILVGYARVSTLCECICTRVRVCMYMYVCVCVCRWNFNGP